jgi:hypothetical protein
MVRPFDASPGFGRGLLLRISPHGGNGRCHELARGAPRDFLNLGHVIRGVVAVFGLIGTLAAAEPAQRSEDRLTEAVKSAAPADGQSADVFSKLGVYGELGPILLHRQSNRSATLIREALTNATVLDATSLDLGWETGLEARGGMKLGDFGAEFRWFNVGRVFRSWSEDAHVVTPVNWEIPTRPMLIGFPVANTSAGLSSTLINMEGNVSWQAHRYLALLAGVRYMSVDDDLGMHFDTGLNVANIGIASRNNLWGGQLGAQGRYPVLTPDLLVGATVKAAYLHNSAKNRFNLIQQTGPSFSAGGHDGRNTWAFELGMDLRYNIFPMVTVLAGYQGLWIGRIAHATDQLNRFNLITAGGDVSARSVWFHGPRAAIVIRFPG